MANATKITAAIRWSAGRGAVPVAFRVGMIYASASLFVEEAEREWIVQEVR
jgi:hypothetical protein